MASADLASCLTSRACWVACLAVGAAERADPRPVPFTDPRRHAQDPCTVLLRHAPFTDRQHTHHLRPTDLPHVQFMALQPQLRLQFTDLLGQLLHHRHLLPTDLRPTFLRHQSMLRHLPQCTVPLPKPTILRHRSTAHRPLSTARQLRSSNPLLPSQSTMPHNPLRSSLPLNLTRSTDPRSTPLLRCTTLRLPNRPPFPLPSTDHPSMTSSRW